MTDQSRLLRAVLEEPADDAPRLVYADWLDENPTAECPECVGGIRRAPGQIKCFGCSGSGRVPSGNAERAEFIRVQCELARLEAEREASGKSGWRTLKLRSRVEALRRRERELWEFAGDWFRDSPLKSIQIAGAEGWRQEPVGLIHRGFVAEVRLTLAALVGRPCERCDGDGQRHGSDRTYPPTPCPACHGTGTRPGIAADLFTAHPVERVTITDAVIHPSGGNDTYYLGGLGVFPKEYWRHLENLPSRRAVQTALETVCVQYGRTLVGLPPLPQPLAKHP